MSTLNKNEPPKWFTALVGVAMLCGVVYACTDSPEEKAAKAAEVAEIERQARSPEGIAKAAAEKRKADIKYQFSSYDGSHRNLVKFVKSNMNDPDSFDHTSTNAHDLRDHLVVNMEYRGKNSYGAVVKGFIKVKTDIETGEILAVVEQF